MDLERPKRPGPFLSPFFVQHAGERTDHSSSGPRHQLSHSWCLGGQDLVQRPKRRLHCPATPCPGAPGPAATVHSIAGCRGTHHRPSLVSPTRVPKALLKSTPHCPFRAYPSEVLKSIKALAQGLYQAICWLQALVVAFAPRQLIAPRISPHRQQGAEWHCALFRRWWRCEPYPIGVA